MILALADAQRRFALPLDALHELIAGVRMDVLETSYERFDELVLYCQRVAGGIGRLCLAIFGLRIRARRRGCRRPRGSSASRCSSRTSCATCARMPRAAASTFRARTSCDSALRGVGEDQRQPALSMLSLEAASADFEELIAFEVKRARNWFSRGISLLEQLDRRSSACVLAMAGIYRRLLDRIAANPGRTLEGRLSLTRREKLWVALLSVLGIGA